MKQKAILQEKKTLLMYRGKNLYFILREKTMNEEQLNVVLGTISEPVRNVYKLSGRKQIEEIRRIVRIFAINEEQKNKHKMLSIKNLATMKIVYSNN